MDTNKKKNFFLGFFIAEFIYNVGASCIHPVTPTMILERGLSNSMFGTAFAVMSIMSFLCAPLWGRLCNYFSTRKLIIIGSAGYFIGQTIFGFCTSDAMAIGGRLISGAFTGCVYTCFANYVVNTTEQGPERARRLTTGVTLQNVGGAVGYFVGGMAGIISVEAAVIALLVLIGGSAVMFRFVMIDDTELKPVPEKAFSIKDANPFAAFANAKNYMTKPLAVFLMVVVLLGTGQICLEQVFNFYIKDQLGMSSAYNGTFKAIVAAASILLNSTLCMYLVKKTDIHCNFYKLMAVMDLPLLLILFIKSPLPFSACYIAFSTINTMRGAMQQSIVSSHSEARYSNDLMGLYQSLNAVGSVLGALFAGFIYDLNPFLPFRLAFAFFTAGVVIACIYAAGRKAKKD